MLPSFDLHEGYDIRFLCDYIYFTASDGKIPLYYVIRVLKESRKLRPPRYCPSFGAGYGQCPFFFA